MADLGARLGREREHGRSLLLTDEKNWGWHTPAGRIRYQRRLEFLQGCASSADASVLEIGAGTGTYSGGLLEKFKRLIAIDISPLLLDRAKERFPAGDFRVMDAHDLAVPPGSLDAVVGCSVLHHLSWSTALQSAFRSLKRGGVVRFSEPNLLNPQIYIQKNVKPIKRWMNDSPDEYAFTPGQIRRALAACGFVDIKAEPFEFLHPSVPSPLIPLAIRLEKLIAATPLVSIGGSILIEARRP